MNRITFTIRLFLDAFRDTIKVTNHFNLLKLNNKFIILKLFLIKLIFSNQLIRKIIKIKKIRINEEFKYKNLVNVNFDQSLIDLDTKGYSETFKIDNKIISELKDLIFISDDYDLKKIQSANINIKKEVNESEDRYYKRLKFLNISRLTGTIDLKKESILRKLILSKEVLEVAASYLNCRDFSINASFFISNPIKISEQEKYINAQYFHWDNDFTKFLKLYIYLTDVNEGGGPHIYIPYTHKKKQEAHKLCRLYGDDQIYSAYNEKKTFYGVAGSSFFVDGYGLHKGATPISNPRLMVNIHFGRGKILYSKNDIYIKI